MSSPVTTTGHWDSNLSAMPVTPALEGGCTLCIPIRGHGGLGTANFLGHRHGSGLAASRGTPFGGCLRGGSDAGHVAKEPLGGLVK